MARSQPAVLSDRSRTWAEIYAVSDRMNRIVLEHIHPDAWRAKPAGGVRTIAAIFAHVHNVRRKWLRLSAPHLKIPAQLDRSRCSQRQTGVALAQSAAKCCEMLAEASSLSRDSSAIFHRDGWARPWGAGTAMLAYMMAHDAHHRGQVCLLAHQLGFRLPLEAGSKIWAWERLWTEHDLTRLP